MQNPREALTEDATMNLGTLRCGFQSSLPIEAAEPQVELKLMQSIKTALEPLNLMNPGKRLP